ncbi:MAG: hypothetical protein ACR2Q4_00955 [Geminicoccaceae bacterium]
MMISQAPATLLQRIDVALTSALRSDRNNGPVPARGQSLEVRDLLIKGVAERDLPLSLGRARLDTPHSGLALVINSFLPWRRACSQLPLCDRLGFGAIQFDVRCPTGLRGTPPHLDLLALRDDHAVAVTVRSVEYLTRKRSPLATSYDKLLGETSGMGLWHDHLADWRARRVGYNHVDLPALIKYATALGRTFPDRSSTLLYLYWEPLDARTYEEFRQHQIELEALSSAVKDARVNFKAESFEALWQGWSELSVPSWISGHVDRLRSRYAVSLGAAN